MLLKEYVSLEDLNTLGVKIQARYYARIGNVQQLRRVLTAPQLKSLPILTLGGGSNVLFLNNFEGIVLHMAIEGITVVREDQAHVWVKAGAGVKWHTLVLYCIEKNYAGIENLSLVPGTVGAAPIQNIGAYGVSLSDTFESLEAMEVRSGTTRTFDKKDCVFGYRESIFKNELKGQYVILNVTLKLHKKPNFQTAYNVLRHTLKAMNTRVLSLKAISDAVVQIRQSRLPDPKRLGSAGSFFKNPIATQQQFRRLKRTHPDVPGYVQPEGHIRIAAAWLIEQCGWKGKTRGSIGIYQQHALILVNYGGGTGQDIYQLAQDVQKSVRDRFNIEIVPEVQLVS